MTKYTVAVIAVISLAGLLCAAPITTNTIVLTNALREGYTYCADAWGRTGLSPDGLQNAQLRGYYTSETVADYPVFVFILPDMGRGKIISANLTLYGTPANAHPSYYSALDLYAIRYKANTSAATDSNVLITDGADSKSYSISNNGTGIMDNMFPNSTNSSLSGAYSTDAAAQVALGNWLTAQYAAGAKAGDYIFLRLTPDNYSVGFFSRGWLVNSADAASNQPVLEVVIEVPPPALGVLGRSNEAVQKNEVLMPTIVSR